MAAPLVNLLTPDQTEFTTQNPTLLFAGTDGDNHRIRYEVEIASADTVQSLGGSFRKEFAYGDGRVVAFTSSVGEAAFVSTDGRNFERSFGFGGTQTTILARYLNGRFFAARSSSLGIRSSVDGYTWTDVLSNTSGIHYSNITYGGGMYLAHGTVSSYRTSTNGTTWTTRAFPWGSGAVRIEYGDGIFLAPTYYGTFSSPDGIVWNELPAAPAVAIPGGSGSLCYGDGVFMSVIAANNNPAQMTTDGGLSWQSTGITSVYDIKYYNGDFYLLSSMGVASGARRIYRRRASMTAEGYDDYIDLGDVPASNIDVNDSMLIYNSNTSVSILNFRKHSYIKSDADGFANETNPSDTEPYASGDTISYQVQASLRSGDYEWSVRGYDLDGDNVWGQRAPKRHFKVTRPQNNTVFMQFLT